MTVSIPAMISVNEGDGTVQVCATLSAVEDIERSFNISLIMHTTDNTGTNYCINAE